MIAFSALILVVALIIGILGMLARRTAKGNVMALDEIGVIVDRALRSYRQHVPALLVCSFIALPLGTTLLHGYVESSMTSLLAPLVFDPAAFWQASPLYQVVVVVGMLGFGKTILGCLVASAVKLGAEGHLVGALELLRRQRWRSVLGLAALVALPSLVSAVVPIIGPLIGVIWALAPAVLVYEQLGPVAALRRGVQIGYSREFSALVGVTFILWLIGWLIAGVPIATGALLIRGLIAPDPQLARTLALLALLAGSVFVAPLLALGSLHFYIYLGGRFEPGPVQAPPAG